jgi:Flp pilus assembly protein TadG
MTKLAKRFAAPQFPRLVELKRGWKGEGAAQIVEFAISLPLLVLFVVGIFDFSNALTLKQRLTNAAREAARVGAADPANDLGSPSTPVPASIGDAFQVVDKYLVSEKINDCGLAAAVPALAGLTWTYTANGAGCPGNGITLAINRGCTNPITTNPGTLNLIGTCITITYAYKWEFNSVANSLGWTASGPSTLSVTAGAFNEN